MSSIKTRNARILIAGSGFAACVCAVQLLRLGFSVRLISRGRPIAPGIEAIPEAAHALFDEFGLSPVLARAGAERVQGFENYWEPTSPAVKPGIQVHVDRPALAAQCLAEAMRLGAEIALETRFPTLREVADAGLYLAVVDATGRSGIWSRPLGRKGSEVARMFEIPDRGPERGRIVRLPKGWAYRIGCANRSTVALVGEPAGRDVEAALELLGVAGPARFLSRRPAFPQWSEDPVSRRRIAIGDAALAYCPVAGQGLRFALHSAVAAVAVLEQWLYDTAGAGLAEEYYRDFVTGARERHLDAVRRLYSGEKRAKAPTLVRENLQFRGRTRRAGVRRDGRIREEEVIELASGGLVRWIGGVDLLGVRDLTASPLPTTDLLFHLAGLGLSRDRAMDLVKWCVAHEVLG